MDANMARQPSQKIADAAKPEALADVEATSGTKQAAVNETFGGYGAYRQGGGCVYLTPPPPEQRTKMREEGLRVCSGGVVFDRTKDPGQPTEAVVEAALRSLKPNEVLVAYAKNYHMSMDGVPIGALLRSVEDFQFIRDAGGVFVFLGKAPQHGVNWCTLKDRVFG